MRLSPVTLGLLVEAGDENARRVFLAMCDFPDLRARTHWGLIFLVSDS